MKRTQITISDRQNATYSDLPLHQVSAGDHLGDGVLHLQSGVHLHEVELLVWVHNKLHCT